MKATFFSVFAAASSALAAPLVDTNGLVGNVGNVVSEATNVVKRSPQVNVANLGGVTDIVSEVTDIVPGIGKRNPQLGDLTNLGGVTDIVSEVTNIVKRNPQLEAVTGIVSEVTDIVPGVVKRNPQLDDLTNVGDVANVGDIVSEVTDIVPLSKRTISTSVELIADLKVAISAVVDLTVSINGLVGKVTGGSLSAGDCTKQVVPLLNKVLKIVTDLVGNLSAGVNIDVSATADLQVIVGLVVKLFTTVLITLKGLVVAIGLRVEIKSILAAVCSILGNLLSLICDLVGDIAPLLTNALGPLLANVSASALGPVLGSVLTPVQGVLSGLGLNL